MGGTTLVGHVVNAMGIYTMIQNDKKIDQVKFIYSEKATKFCEISINYLSYVFPVKYLVEILQNFVAFSEYMNFKKQTNQIRPFGFWEKLADHKLLSRLTNL